MLEIRSRSRSSTFRRASTSGTRRNLSINPTLLTEGRPPCYPDAIVAKLKSLAEALGLPEGESREDVVDPYVEPTSAAEFARNILRSAAYRLSILSRIADDKLPAAVEVLLHHYAWGKPVERVEHTGKDGAPMETITEVRRTVVRVDHDIDEPRPAPPIPRTH